MNTADIKGFIFDLDGTLIDSERIIEKVHTDIAREWKLGLDKNFFSETVCIAPKQMEKLMKCELGESFEYNSFKAERDKRIRSVIQKHGVPVMPGADEIINKIRKKGYRMGIASSSSRKTILWYIEQAGWKEKFDVVVGRDMVGNTKPAPDCYLLAASLLKLKPEETIAVEDSNNGIESAYFAGCRTLLIEGSAPLKKSNYDKCFAVFKTLTGLNELIDS